MKLRPDPLEALAAATHARTLANTCGHTCTALFQYHMGIDGLQGMCGQLILIFQNTDAQDSKQSGSVRWLEDTKHFGIYSNWQWNHTLLGCLSSQGLPGLNDFGGHVIDFVCEVWQSSLGLHDHPHDRDTVNCKPPDLKHIINLNSSQQLTYATRHNAVNAGPDQNGLGKPEVLSSSLLMAAASPTSCITTRKGITAPKPALTHHLLRTWWGLMTQQGEEKFAGLVSTLGRQYLRPQQQLWLNAIVQCYALQSPTHFLSSESVTRGGSYRFSRD